MTNQLNEYDTREIPIVPISPLPARTPTGWALKHRVDSDGNAEPTCTCGSGMAWCAGCGQLRCLSCDPYLSDDCRWGL